jgi:hypothetical protein
MSSPEVGEERLEALLAGAAPATPAEEELVAFMIELRGEPVGAPASLRARVGTLAAAPSAMERLRAALSGPGFRRSIMIAAPACSLALAAGVVIGIGQSPSPAPAPAEMMFNADPGAQRTSTPSATKPPKQDPRASGQDQGAGSSTPAAATSAPAPAPAPTDAPTAIEAAPTVSPDSVTAQGSGARVLPDAGTPDEREAAQAGAVADALADAAEKAERAANRAGVELGPPEAVAVDAPPTPTCAPAAPVAPAPAGTPAAAPAPEPAPAAAPTCTVAADVNVTYPTQTDGTTASPPSP